ncbi:MAG: altronate oxidoreductase [Phycisphaerae bacterium]
MAGPAAPEALRSAPERVLLIGTGNFQRAFAGWMIHEMNRRGLFLGRAVITPATPASRTSEVFTQQDGCYTVLARGRRDGEMHEQTTLVTAISRAVSPWRDWRGFLEISSAPSLRFVISNTTEAGIAYEPISWPVNTCPASFPARAAAMLYERFQRTQGAVNAGLIFLPCELIENNGTTLREIILRHVADWELEPAFRDWLENTCRFANTLVDRIVPGFPEAQAARLFEENGYEDRLLTTCELYHNWVIEADASLADELPLPRAGLSVTLTQDVGPYRTRKVRILNGAHTAMVPVALLAGLDTVRESIEDPAIASFIQRCLFEEIIPTLDSDAGDPHGFARDVLDRFRNPTIEHKLRSIALNCTSKWQVRVLPSLNASIRRHGRPPPGLCASLAALLALYRTNELPAGGARSSHRLPTCPLQDTPQALGLLREAWKNYDQGCGPEVLCRDVLARSELWGEDLNSLPGLLEHVARDLDLILRHGVRVLLG